jgi:hypothetical protein
VLAQQTGPAPDVPTVDLSGDESKTVRILATNISDWNEGNERVILMRGKVFVQQDLVGVYLQEGIAWIASESKNGTTVYHLDIYGEAVDLEPGNGAPRRKAARMRLKLNTVGIWLKAYGDEPRHESARADALFTRALGVRGTGWAQAAAPQTLAALPQDVPQTPPLPMLPLPPLPGNTGTPSSGTLMGGSNPAQQAEQRPPELPLPLPPSPPLNPAMQPPPAPPVNQPLPLLPAQAVSQPAQWSPSPMNPPAPLPPSPSPPGSAAPTPLPTVLPSSLPPAGWIDPQLGSAQFGTAAPAGQPETPVPSINVPQPPPPPSTAPGGTQMPSDPIQFVQVPTPSAQLPGQAPAATPPIPIPNPNAKKAAAAAPPRWVTIRSRDGSALNPSKGPAQANGESVYMFPSGVNIIVMDIATRKILIDMEADRLVFWSKDGNDTSGGLPNPEGQKTNAMEFYLSGHVQIRNQQSPKETQTIRADEVYYDVSRNVAVAINADVETISPKIVYPGHFQGEIVYQVGPKRFEAVKARVFATMFPSDPGIQILFEKAVLEEQDTPKTSIFGIPFYSMKTKKTDPTPEKILTGEKATFYVENVPVMYFPTFKADADRPLGPLSGLGVNYSSIFGFQMMTTWDAFYLLGIIPDAGKKWDLYADYMTARGPGLGTSYKDEGKNLFSNFFDITNKYEFNLKLYGIYDHGTDDIGGSRGTLVPANPTDPNADTPVINPQLRGRLLAQLYMSDLPNNFTFVSQLAAISDQNYLDQYNNPEWLNGLNQDTFAYVKQQKEFWYWSAMVEDRIRPWITETNWLPKLDGYMAGVDLFNTVTWNTKVGAGYAQLLSTNAAPGSYSPTDQSTSTARLDWWQDFSLPFNIGDARVIPYVVTDLTYYSHDLAGEEAGRAYGGAGLRGSIPLSKLYPDIQSDLFNLDGIFHKIALTGNYYVAYTNIQPGQLPQLDRLNDDASNQALNNIHPLQYTLNPSNSYFLTTSPLFNPQFFALQRLVDNQVDTLGSIDVFQANLTQRWQTKRGVAGDEHLVDWMTLDLGVAVFPQAERDNFNQAIGLLSYDWLWNIGDRTSVFSNGWMDPVSGGPHFWTFGAAYNRPDRTNFTVAYRQIDPLDSKAIIASITYPLSAKYAITGSTMYDFGVQNETTTIMLTRIGTDLRTSFGFSYNSILNNFSVVFEIVPNLIPNTGKGFGGGSGGSGGLGGTQR